MKKILILCGTGIVTSTIVKLKLGNWMNDRDLSHKICLYQTKVSEGINRINEYDIVISTTIVPDDLRGKVIDGIPLLTGIDEDEIYQRLLNEIEDELT